MSSNGRGPLIKVNWTPEIKREEYRKFWTEMYPVVVRAVEQSFMDGDTALRVHTDAEVKERARVAKRLVDAMRVDLGWSKVRIKDTLQLALKAKLAGLEVDLNDLAKRGTW